jgi:predicted DNA binding CopG/RHH family protein
MGKTQEQWLAESDYWDQFTLEELWEMSEPVDWRPIDARPKKAISIRLTEKMIGDAKRIANELGIGYQTLFRMWLMDGLKRHRLRELKEQRRRLAPEPKPAATRAGRPRRASPTPRPRSGRGVSAQRRE